MTRTTRLPAKPPADLINSAAVHEAGHAVVAMVLRLDVRAVSIRQSGVYGGYCDFGYLRVRAMSAIERRRWRDYITATFAGREAESQIVPVPDLMIEGGDEGDLEDIAKLLPRAIGSSRQSERDLRATLQRRAARLVTRYRIFILRVAAMLVANEVLTGVQLRAIIAGYGGLGREGQNRAAADYYYGRDPLAPRGSLDGSMTLPRHPAPEESTASAPPQRNATEVNGDTEEAPTTPRDITVQVESVPDTAHERWLTALHEAGHAVAALHFCCPFTDVIVEHVGDSLGKIRRMRHQYLEDAVVIMCGPLAELPWKVHWMGITTFKMYNSDHRWCRDHLTAEQTGDCVGVALRFMRRSDVQAQIGRVAKALKARGRLSADDVRAVSGFSRCSCRRYVDPKGFSQCTQASQAAPGIVA